MGLLIESLRSQDALAAAASSEARKHGFTPEQWRSSFGVCANTESTTAIDNQIGRTVHVGIQTYKVSVCASVTADVRVHGTGCDAAS